MRWAPDDGFVALGSLWSDRITGGFVEVVGFRRHISRTITVTLKHPNGTETVVPYDQLVAEFDRAPVDGWDGQGDG